MPIQQLTGLKDKNGEEIYEGGVVKDQDGIVCQILPWDESPDELNAIKKMIMMVDVIGNIFENP